jgi:tRNA-modifying protein YgfZ
MTMTGYIPLPNRALITISGEDAASFLQGLITIDSEKLAVGSVAYGCLLTPQGKFAYDFFLLRREETLFWLETAADRANELARRLSMFRLRSKVSIELAASEAAVFALFAEALPAGLTGYADPRHKAMGFRVIADSQDAGMTALDAAGFEKLPISDYEEKRISLGLPDGARDMEVDKSTMLEGNMEQLGAVDWQKGCYMGQELTARTRYRGLVKKRLIPLLIDGPLPEPGSPVELDGSSVGETRSAFGNKAIALMKLSALEEAQASGKAFTIGKATASPAIPDWLQLAPENIGSSAG